jgi:tetratricopeptide (TPR) repeat protein
VRRAGLGAFLVLAAAGGLVAQADPERLRAAKALFFDRKYAEARAAWQQVLAASRGADAETAAYWVARSSENLGERERAFKEYDAFLARKPANRALAEEARTNRVGLAARLYKDGRKEYLPVLHGALDDPSRTVRYYAALQSCGLGPEAGKPALPLLKAMVQSETDEDLVQRAKLCLLRLDPGTLSDLGPARPAPSRGAEAGKRRMLKLRISEHGRRKVSVDVPLALAEIVFKSLPDEAKRELRKKGYGDPERFWEELVKLGPTQIIEVEGDEVGERIQIWIE